MAEKRTTTIERLRARITQIELCQGRRLNELDELVTLLKDVQRDTIKRMALKSDTDELRARLAGHRVKIADGAGQHATLLADLRTVTARLDALEAAKPSDWDSELEREFNEIGEEIGISREAEDELSERVTALEAAKPSGDGDHPPQCVECRNEANVKTVCGNCLDHYHRRAQELVAAERRVDELERIHTHGLPRCTSRRGHKWEPRYGAVPLEDFMRVRDSAWETTDLLQRLRPYLGDICTRCGAERKGLVKP